MYCSFASSWLIIAWLIFSIHVDGPILRGESGKGYQCQFKINMITLSGPQIKQTRVSLKSDVVLITFHRKLNGCFIFKDNNVII